MSLQGSTYYLQYYCIPVCVVQTSRALGQTSLNIGEHIAGLVLDAVKTVRVTGLDSFGWYDLEPDKESAL